MYASFFLQRHTVKFAPSSFPWQSAATILVAYRSVAAKIAKFGLKEVAVPEI